MGLGQSQQKLGYLPAALRNYLARLAWSHGDDEIFSTEQAVEWFDVTDINKAPARFDFAKLADLNGHYIRATPNDELIAHLEACLPSILSADFSRLGEEIGAVMDAGVLGPRL